MPPLIRSKRALPSGDPLALGKQKILARYEIGSRCARAWDRCRWTPTHNEHTRELERHEHSWRGQQGRVGTALLLAIHSLNGRTEVGRGA